MSEWQNKSDFEINKAVARVEGFFMNHLAVQV